MERQYIPTIYLEKELGIGKEGEILETSHKKIDTYVPSLAEGKLRVTIYPTKIVTPEETPGVRRSSRVQYQTKLDHIPSMSGKQYKIVNNQLEYEEILNSDDKILFCQEIIE